MYQYIAFYKPFQVMCQFSPEGEKRTLSNYFPAISKDIYPVGRLDYDSEGLLLLTNDKKLTNMLLSPVFGHERTYWVQVEGIPDQFAINTLQNGVLINVDGKKYLTKKCNCEILTDFELIQERNPPIRFRKNIPVTWLKITLTEGKNRQVRKMTAAVGFPTLRLIRVSIGKYLMKNFLPGNYVQLNSINVNEMLVNG